jgi:pantoate--beta-alanine ligase
MVKLIQTTEEFKLERAKDTEVGFVPTMGNLHAGHISLLERALSEFKTVYFSIFVNPKQFGPNEDFNRYPRTLESDLNLIQKSVERFPNSKVVVYSPKDPEEVFPEGESQTISVYGLSTDLEGKIRPGHFDGVATVVYRLFDLVKPTKAYFGLKDYQQYLVIKTMVSDLSLPIKIVGMPIIRETEGLALSSRNQYLSHEQKTASLLISRTLKEIENKINGSSQNLLATKSYIHEVLKDPNWNYLEIRDAETFSDDLSLSKKLTILAVYQMGTTRLLDNIQVNLSRLEDQ